ncbi:UNVERIFIED_CONTAM: hypothetical protein FKN15_017572 [Acipenser sinensis]
MAFLCVPSCSAEGVCRCFYTVNESKVSPVQGIHKRDEWYNGCRSDNPRKREPMHRVGNIEFKGSGKKRGKFVIEHCTTDPAALYEVLTEEWNLTPPHLVVSLVGGDEDFQMKPWLRDTLRKGLVKAAQSTGAWIVTSGLRVGITTHVGEAVRDHSLASTSSKVKVIAIGIAPWKMIRDKETLLTAKPGKPAFYETAEQPSGSLYSLDSNHSHFILVDEDERHKDGTTEMRIKLLKHISEQRTGYGGTGIEIPVLCLLRIYRGMLNSTPWLILAGSGGIADILVDMMSRPCDPDYVQEQLQEKFHTEFAWTDILKCTKMVQIILEHRHLLTIHNPGQEGSEELDTVILKALVQIILEHRHLLTIHNPGQEGSEELDTVILKALVKACKSQSQEAQEYLDELKLAVAWNRVDIAKSEIFSGEVEWRPCDLEEVMMDALVSNKPDFVKLFIDNGMNMCDFLTYSKLQDLYCAIPPKCLLHQLLQKKHEETKLSISARNDSMADSLEQKPKFTLYEVSRVLKDFLHDSCKGFYQETTKRGTMERAGISRVSHVQKASLNMNQKCENPWRDLFLWAVLQNRQEMANYFWATAAVSCMADSLEQKPKFTLYEVSRVLKDFLHDSCKGFYQETTKRGTMERASISRVSHVQKASLNMNQKCENPWRDLFLWAVLQNRQEMANYFWATGPEAVAAALAGCKILKEMAHLESEAESARSMKEAKYEQFAQDLFSECYTNSEDRAFALLVRKTKSWNKTTCLDLATEADAKSFFAHDGVQSHLTKMWWGAMKSDTRIWKLMLSFFCPPLIYTNLITFSEDEHHTVGGAEQFKELDSQDSEKAMLLTQRQNSDTIKPEKEVTGSNNVCMKFLFTRWKKFWGAPVTVFLGNVIMYFAFLFLFTYVILVDFQPPPPYGPSIPEITLYFWVFTLVLEELRQSFFTDEDTSIIKKFKLYVEDSWNKCDMVAILLFVLGVSCRMAGSTYEAGRTVLALDFMVFALRLIHIFAIHKQLGPKIIIVERMMKDVFFFLFFLSVWLIAYGVATQALLHPNDTRVDWIFRRVLYRPYLHIFGQIPLEEIDVLQNRQEMANYFWATGPEAVAAALAGCKILKEMAHLESEAESARSMKEAKYEQFALDLFSECYTNSEDRAFALLVRKTKSWNKTTCLDLATEADAKSFFAHDGVQSHLTKMWWGAMKSDTRIWKLMLSFFCPPLIYTNLITFSEDEHHTVGGAEQFKELDSQDSEKAMLLTQRQNSDTIKPEKQVTASNNVCMKFLFTRWKKFWGAPVTVFLGNVIMYFAFLFLFTYVILVDFQPPPPYGPSIPEITLYFWVFTLVLEELRQSFFTDEDTSIIKKFKLYVEDSWNKCDMVAILLFVLGVSCRMAGSTYEAGRTVLALDFMVFALRLIHIFAIHKQLGPKIIIVERMMKDVFFFLFFLSVWLIAYGVATQALLHPNDTRVDWIFRRVLYRPYLHIFGQIPLEEIDGARMPEQNCTIDPIEIMNETFSPCPNLYANWLVILLLVIFLLVTNVLLLNLLIAMFSYTFQVVQGNADIFWKFQRYNLIVEYFSRPSLAPPFIIISHISQVICSMFKNAEPKQELLERDFPEGLDQKLMTWETVQKENYLANLEKEKRESSEERLKKTSHKVDSLLKIIGGFKEQEKRLVTVETQIKYCSDVLSWLADCFTQSSLKCNRAAPKHSSSMVSGSKKQQRSMAEEESTARRTDILMTDLKYIDD